jgi:hypothetical protein
LHDCTPLHADGSGCSHVAKSTSGAGMWGASIDSRSKNGDPKKRGSLSAASRPGTGTAAPARWLSTRPSRRTSYGSKIPRVGWIRSTAVVTGPSVTFSRQVTFDKPSVSGSTPTTRAFSNPVSVEATTRCARARGRQLVRHVPAPPVEPRETRRAEGECHSSSTPFFVDESRLPIRSAKNGIPHRHPSSAETRVCCYGRPSKYRPRDGLTSAGRSREPRRPPRRR